MATKPHSVILCVQHEINIGRFLSGKRELEVLMRGSQRDGLSTKDKGNTSLQFAYDKIAYGLLLFRYILIALKLRT